MKTKLTPTQTRFIRLLQDNGACTRSVLFAEDFFHRRPRAGVLSIIRACTEPSWLLWLARVCKHAKYKSAVRAIAPEKQLRRIHDDDDTRHDLMYLLRGVGDMLSTYEQHVCFMFRSLPGVTAHSQIEAFASVIPLEELAELVKKCINSPSESR